MSDFSNSKEAHPGQQAALREFPYDLAAIHLEPARSKKKVQSAPTSATVVQSVKRSSSLTVICMDELQNVSTTTRLNVSIPIPTDANIQNHMGATFSKGEEPVVMAVAVPIPTHVTPKNPQASTLVPLPPLPPISRKQSQVAPSTTTTTTVHQSQLIPLEKISITEQTDPVREQNQKQESTKSGGFKKAEKIDHVIVTGAENYNQQTGFGAGGGHEPAHGPSSENFEEVCRICHDNPSRMTLLSPCLCKVHRVCLERWLGESAKTNCEICGHEYETERRPRYTGWRSVVAWIRNPLTPTDTRNLFFDLACFFILTPLAAISAWLCVTLNPEGGNSGLSLVHDDLRNPSRGQSAIGKYRNKNIEASNSTWTSIGLLTLTGTLLAAYYVWLFVAVRYHIQVWREWQARNFVVTISPLNPERIRQLREAHAAAEVADMHDEVPERHPATVRAQNVTKNNNNNNNVDTFGTMTSSSSADSNSVSNNNPYQQRKLREKTLARVFEETLSMKSNGTISTEAASQDNAGPSNFKPSQYSDADVDSVQGKVITIPSEASFNAHDDEHKA